MVRADKKHFDADARALQATSGINDIVSRFGDAGAASQSGNERNHLFLSNWEEEGQFYDVSGISGVDTPADGRSFAWLDYDRDGWLDLGVASANAPLFQLFNSRLGEWQEKRGKARFVALRFVGGNHASTPASAGSGERWSARDGYGAWVSADLGELTVRREQRCGEGLAAQNSATMMLGIGAHEVVAKLSIRWPSGRTQELEGVPAGTLVTVYENPEHSPDGSGFQREPYTRDASATGNGAPRSAPTGAAPPALTLERTRASGVAEEGVVMYSMTATWCGNCKKELPELANLRQSFEPEELAMYGVPWDAEEGPEVLQKYLREFQPPYELLTDLSIEDRARVQELMSERLGKDEPPLPMTLLTGADGTLLLARFGAPSVSEIRRLLNERG